MLENGSFYDYLLNEGFYFDSETIENFLLSLKVKPFVILTGNPGTGKTKLPVLFANYIKKLEGNTEMEFVDKTHINKHDTNNLDYIDTDVIVGKSSKNGGWTVKRHDFSSMVPINIFEGHYPIVVDGIESEGKFNVNLRIFYQGENKGILAEHLKDLPSEDRVNLRLFYDKEKIIQDMANLYEVEILNENKSYMKTNDSYKLIPVGANWDNKEDLIGYFDKTTKEYSHTIIYDLIKTATKDSANPYFLILDDMNISSIEEYFSEFLSAIESGEEIPLDGLEKGLFLPNNLFIIGTISNDENSFELSSKVYDRANTIELNTYSAADYMSEEFNLIPPDGDLNYLHNVLSDLNIRNASISELRHILTNVTFHNQKLWDILSDEIYKIQEVLGEYNLDFGFRVINEIIKFMVVAWKYENCPNEWNNWEKYFDAQIKQKILPKLEKNDRVTDQTLENLLNICMNGNDFKYPNSAFKLVEINKYFDEL